MNYLFCMNRFYSPGALLSEMVVIGDTEFLVIDTSNTIGLMPRCRVLEINFNPS